MQKFIKKTILLFLLVSIVIFNTCYVSANDDINYNTKYSLPCLPIDVTINSDKPYIYLSDQENN